MKTAQQNNPTEQTAVSFDMDSSVADNWQKLTSSTMMKAI